MVYFVEEVDLNEVKKDKVTIIVVVIRVSIHFIVRINVLEVVDFRLDNGNEKLLERENVVVDPHLEEHVNVVLDLDFKDYVFILENKVIENYINIFLFINLKNLKRVLDKVLFIKKEDLNIEEVFVNVFYIYNY